MVVTGTRDGDPEINAAAAEPDAASRLAGLYEEHAPAARRLAYLLTGQPAAAEDLVQEAFVRVAGRTLRVNDAHVFRAYLRRTVINLHTSHQRRRKVERTYLEREATRLVPDAPPPDIDLQEDLWRRLLALPSRQRAALVLRYYEDLSEQDTAGILRCSRSAAKSLTARALETLRADLREETDRE